MATCYCCGSTMHRSKVNVTKKGYNGVLVNTFNHSNNYKYIDSSTCIVLVYIWDV